MNFVELRGDPGFDARSVSVQAQRAPVLRQIKVPHSYYYPRDVPAAA